MKNMLLVLFLVAFISSGNCYASDYIDLEPCTVLGNEDVVCQNTDKTFEPVKFIIPIIYREVRSYMYEGTLYVFTDNKPASVLVRNPKYIGQGLYCYADGYGWICEEK